MSINHDINARNVIIYAVHHSYMNRDSNHRGSFYKPGFHGRSRGWDDQICGDDIFCRPSQSERELACK